MPVRRDRLCAAYGTFYETVQIHNVLPVLLLVHALAVAGVIRSIDARGIARILREKTLGLEDASAVLRPGRANLAACAGCTHFN